MAMIDVVEINQGTFRVTVDASSSTEHEVTVDSTYAQTLTNGVISTDELVKKSFEFLLDKEPNTSILRRFNLTVISRYFPDYESVIKA